MECLLFPSSAGGVFKNYKQAFKMIVSMTTWPPREHSCIEAWHNIVKQTHSEPVRYVLVLSDKEWGEGRVDPKRLLQAMEEMGVEVLWDKGNIFSHKKLIPTLERYPDEDILVVDDDVAHEDCWLQTFIDDHNQHPSDIIYGVSICRVDIINDRIVEDANYPKAFISKGKRTFLCKPANGANGTLYPAGTFTDPRFFDRELFMRLSPTSDETWQWAWGIMTGRHYRCLSEHNYPAIIDANQECALWHTNRNRYSDYHNAIAEVFPEYKKRLIELKSKEL